MIERIENFIKGLMSALQIAELYPSWHPQYRKFIAGAFQALEDILKDKDTIVIGIVGEELAYEREIFFGLSKITRQMILSLKERGVEKIVFNRGITCEELVQFVTALLAEKGKLPLNAQGDFLISGAPHISASRLRSGAEPDRIEAGRQYNYEEYLQQATAIFEGLLDADEVDLSGFQRFINGMMDNLLDKYHYFLDFASLKRYDSRTFFHSFNVSLLSMYITSRMGLTRESVLEIGAAALFHDIGKMYISRKIIQKPARLTETEFDVIKNHVVSGSEILLKYVSALGPLAVVVCFEHHVKYDLSGYPKVSYKHKPHPASLIVSMCDVYDALLQRRSYKNDYSPKMIYELMNRERATSFDPELLDIFFKILGVWPIGTMVRLTDSRVAVVREQNEDDVFNPKIEILDPSRHGELIDLKSAQGQLAIQDFLNPLTDGKEYLPLLR